MAMSLIYSLLKFADCSHCFYFKTSGKYWNISYISTAARDINDSREFPKYGVKSYERAGQRLHACNANAGK